MKPEQLVLDTLPAMAAVRMIGTRSGLRTLSWNVNVSEILDRKIRLCSPKTLGNLLSDAGEGLGNEE